VSVVAYALQPGAVGRYQIVGSAANAHLIDTVTGDTWRLCWPSVNVPEWCRMARTDAITPPMK